MGNWFLKFPVQNTKNVFRSIKKNVTKIKLFRRKKKRGIEIECSNMDIVSGHHNSNSDSSEFVELDPTGRYGRYNEILGRGSSKTVYRAFDEYEGMEVAWNQVKLNGYVESPDDLRRLYSEIHLLQTLKHENIMKFYTYWVDVPNRKINFITELFTPGNLKQYRLKHRDVNIRALKKWCRQILSGLLYLHSHDPPVIHRDIKCDNIFVNGSQGEVKIGDFGLAAILKNDTTICVGTPEFMAPEVYEDTYNESVDIYSFGMCVLEMVTFEYPYSECTSPTQIYFKVISGKKPDAFYKVMDPEVRQFVEKCLAPASSRLSARELLNDLFLQTDEYELDRHKGYGGETDGVGSYIKQPLLEEHGGDHSSGNGHSNGSSNEAPKEQGYHCVENESSGVKLYGNHDDEHFSDVDISIKGKRRKDGSIFLRLWIADKKGRVRKICFPFEIEKDTAQSVAHELVVQVDIIDQDITKIADMIDGEIVSLVPQWKPGPRIEETPAYGARNLYCNCASNHTSYGSKDSQFLQCCNHGCSSVHGRFEEITCKADDLEHHVKDGAAEVLSQTDCSCNLETEDQRGSEKLSSEDSSHMYSDKYYDTLQSVPSTDEELTSGCERASNAVVKDFVEGSSFNNSNNLTKYIIHLHQRHFKEVEECIDSRKLKTNNSFLTPVIRIKLPCLWDRKGPKL